MYNQIKGKFIHSLLDSNELKKMIIRGNAESIYLVKDEDDAYLGPNYTSCSHMIFYFEDKDLDDIKFYTTPDSNLTPIEKAGQTELNLPGFNWQASKRPLNARSIVKRSKTIINEQPMEQDSFSLKVMETIQKTTKPKAKAKSKGR